MRKSALRSLLFIVLLSLPMSALAQQGPGRRPPAVIATGTAEVFAAPDRATVRLGVQEQAQTADAAQKAVNEKMNRILKDLRKLGVPEGRIRTARAELFPVYAYPQNRGGTPELTGFRASNSVAVTLDLAGKGPAVGAVIDTGIRSGANSVEGIAFTLADDTKQRAEALQKAAKNARQKAESIATALGVQLGELIAAGEAGGGAGGPPRPMMRSMALEASDASQATAIEPGLVRVEASVEVRYAVK